MPQPILIAEDDENDAILLQRAFERAKIINPLVFVRNGEDVIQYLSGMGIKAGVAPTLPALLLLDLKMPKMGGFEVLQWIRSRKPLNRLVVIILSSSGERNDINRAFDLHANSYVVKPGTFNQTVEMLTALHNYWFCWNERPDTTAELTPLPDLRVSKSKRGK